MRFRLFFLFVPVCILSALFSCGTLRLRKVTAFFFDGVPAATSDSLRDTQQRKDQSNKADSVLFATRVLKDPYHYHVPYKEKNCSDCHKDVSNGEMVDDTPALCYICHEDFKAKYKVVHGPVSSGYCTKCHNPHMSQNEKLLTRTGQQLCLYCHDPRSLKQGNNHEEIGTTSCTECHNPHGGDDRYLLK